MARLYLWAQRAYRHNIRPWAKASGASRKIAADKGYTILNVISSVGTRYYRAQGFKDADLYQQKEL